MLFSFVSFIAFGQNMQISGVVTEKETGETIPGASIVIKGTQTGVVTDFDGNYTIEAAKGDILQATFIGMVNQEVVVAESNEINISLLTDIAQLENVVVIGYGVQKKSVITGAISSVKADAISKTSVPLVTQALQGQTAGVTVLPSSGSPGASVKIRIRGAGSNGNSDPIYVVDGMRTGNIDFLDPSDIESIEILKDAASAAIYGADGGNGVVLVSTKKGKSGTINVSYNMSYGIQSVRNSVDMMNADQYVQWIHETEVPGGRPNLDEWAGKNGTNWMDATAQDAPMQRHNFQVSGGGEMSTFLLSGNYFTQDGIFGGEQTNFNRTTIRFNSNHKVSKYLEIGNNFSYSINKRKAFTEDDSYNGIMNHAMLMDPTTPVSYPKGSTLPTHVQDALDAGQPLLKNSNGEYYGISKYLYGEIANPLGQIDLDNGLFQETKFIGNVFANIKPFEGLVITTRMGIEQAFNNYEDWTRKSWWNPNKLNASNTKTFNQGIFKTWLWENFATYSKAVGDHEFSAMVGMSAQESEYQFLNSTISGMIKEEEAFTQVGDAPVDAKVSGNKYPTSMNSYFGRLTYSYANKYLLQFSMRNDNSSLFAPAERAGYFPALSAGWLISNENFWNVDKIDFLKLRASWGQNGSTANVGAGQWQALVTKDGLKYPDAFGNFHTVGELKALPNEGLTWETSEQTDIGIDLRAFNSRLTIGLDYFKKITKDLLTPSSPPLHLGYPAPFANAGDVTNQGFEIEIGWRDVVGEFSYGVNMNVTTLKNEVTYLNPLLDRVDGTALPVLGTITSFELGQPVWFYRGYKTDGIFQNQDEIDAYKQGLGEVTTWNPSPGDPIVVDANGDGDINDQDRTNIGDPHPDVLLATTLDFAYKGFDLRIFMQGAFGHENFMALARVDNPNTNRPAFFFEDRWTGEGSTNEWFKPTYDDPITYTSDLMVQSASYLKIKQIQLGYNFSKELSAKMKMQNLRVFISLDDYFTFTKYKGVDPEVGSFSNNSQGIDRGLYPIPGRFMMGLSVTF